MASVSLVLSEMYCSAWNVRVYPMYPSAKSSRAMGSRAARMSQLLWTTCSRPSMLSTTVSADVSRIATSSQRMVRTSLPSVSA